MRSHGARAAAAGGGAGGAEGRPGTGGASARVSGRASSAAEGARGTTCRRRRVRGGATAGGRAEGRSTPSWGRGPCGGRTARGDEGVQAAGTRWWRPLGVESGEGQRRELGGGRAARGRGCRDCRCASLPSCLPPGLHCGSGCSGCSCEHGQAEVCGGGGLAHALLRTAPATSACDGRRACEWGRRGGAALRPRQPRPQPHRRALPAIHSLPGLPFASNGPQRPSAQPIPPVAWPDCASVVLSLGQLLSISRFLNSSAFSQQHTSVCVTLPHSLTVLGCR